VARGAEQPTGPQTPDQIVEQIEQTREQLAVTVDALVDRTSPKNVLRRTAERIKARFFAPDGSPRVAELAKVGGAVVGAIAAVVAVRRVAGGR